MSAAACKAILNGTITAAVLNNLVAAIEREGYKDGPHAHEIIELLNTAENAAFEAARYFLEDTGFKGPWPKSMTGD